MRTFIFKVKYGGLGDHLFHSHLPRIAKEMGYNKVYMSNNSEFRHKDYYDFIWKLNPFLDGQIDADAPYPEVGSLDLNKLNLLDAVMLSRGLDNHRRFHEPELYYTPKVKPELVDKVIFDPNYLSYTGEIINSNLISFLQSEGDIDLQMAIRDRTFGFRTSIPTIQAANIYDYCNIIHSCKKFYGLISGGATLAAAIGKPSIILYGDKLKDMFRHSKLHTYVKV